MLQARRISGCNAPLVEPARASSADERTLLLAALACAVLIYVVPLFLNTPLLDPDEGLHAAISQEMVETGDYLIPRFRGEPFPDKPIVYFWTQALSLRLFGMNETAVRLPGLMFSVLGALTAGLLAWSLFNRSVGLLTVLIALTMPMPLILAQAAAHDVALVPWTNLALLALWHADHQGPIRRRLAATFGAAVALGLAILTKGLIGVAFVAIAYGLYVLVDRRLRLAVLGTSFGALFLGILLASPWFLAYEARSPGYLHYYFWQRHVLGFTTASQVHATSRWYYYLICLLPGTVPWALHAVSILPFASAGARRPSVSSPIRLLLTWFFGGLLFLSLAKSKLITYALPLCPAVAILAAVAWERVLRGSAIGATLGTLSAGRDGARGAGAGLLLARPWFSGLLYSGAIAGMIAPAATLFVFQFALHVPSHWLVWCGAAMATAHALVVGRCIQLGRVAPMLSSMALWTAAFFLSLLSGPGQSMGEQYTLREVARSFNAKGHLPQEVIIVGNGFGSLIFYLEPSLRRDLRAGQIREIVTEQLPEQSPIHAGSAIVLSDRDYRWTQRGHLQIDAPAWIARGGQHVFSGPGAIQTELATRSTTAQR